MSSSFSDTWINIITNPTGFFKNMPKSGSYVVPLKFATINFLAGSIVTFLIIHIYNAFFYNISGAEIFFNIIFYVLFNLVVLISTINYHIFFKIMGGKGTYEGTFRQITYSTAPLSLFLIPFLQIIVYGVVDLVVILILLIFLIVYAYSIFLLIIGGKYLHNISEVRSTIAIFFPTLLIFGLFFFIFLIPSFLI